MKTSTRISRVSVAVVVAALLLELGGCGSSSSSSGSSGDAARSSQKKTHHATDPSNRPPEDMITAVSAGKGGPPVGLKFELRTTPEAGKALEVDLAVIPDAVAIERIQAKFQGGENLSVVEGGDLADIEKPAQRSVIRHVVRVLPKQDGIFTLSATVTVDLANDSITRTFTIPVVVGQGLPELAAKSGSEVAGGSSAAGTGPKQR